ncbi:MAG: metallophosphoesterase family protein [Candidatus Omnitrophica bacterium]|nr:metallophosphoesterase family protein [Candidatus Omnitrophota bacterium]
MKYAIIADIHANLEAFLAVEEDLKKETVDKYICLGDIVGYGANPIECMDAAGAMFDVIIAGNHDYAVCGLFDLSLFNPYARKSVEWTIAVVGEKEKNLLKTLTLTKELENFTIVHGSLYHPDEFNYILNLKEAAKTFDKLRQKICFIGHSHSPAIIIKDYENKIDYHKITETTILKDSQYIINVGSVGQPRDGDPRACYCVYDSVEKTVKIKRVEYAVSRAQEKIIKAGLPQFLATRLGGGR